MLGIIGLGRLGSALARGPQTQLHEDHSRSDSCLCVSQKYILVMKGKPC
jgi:hypothetical protein